MKFVMEACLIGSILSCGANAQDSRKMALAEGISVQMPVASQAMEMRAADEPDAKIVAIAANGEVFVGSKSVEPGALSNLIETIVYLKADSRVPYQRIVTVLEALRGKSVVLLTAPPANAAKQGIAPPYGIRLIVSP